MKHRLPDEAVLRNKGRTASRSLLSPFPFRTPTACHASFGQMQVQVLRKWPIKRQISLLEE